MTTDAAQPPVSFPRQEAATRRFRLGLPRAFRLSPDGGRLAFIRSAGGRDPVGSLWVAEAMDGRLEERRVVDARTLVREGAELPAAEKARRERMRETTGGITAYSVDAALSRALFSLDGIPYVVDLAMTDAAAREVPSPGPVVDPQLSPDGRWAAYVSDRAVHAVPVDDAAGTGAVCLAAPENDLKSWGLADFIAAEEFDRSRGLWWLGTSDRLLAEFVDESEVEVRWISDPAQPQVAPVPHRYPAAGTANPEARLFVLSLDGTRTELTWDRDAYPYLTTVVTDDLGGAIVSVLSRSQDRQLILELAPGATALAEVRERVTTPWVTILPGVPCRAPDGGLLEIVANIPDDTFQLVVDDRPLTPPGLQVAGVMDVSDDRVVVVGTSDSMDQHVVHVAWDGTVEQLTSGPSVNSVVARGDAMLIATARPDRVGTDYHATLVGASGPIGSLAETPAVDPVVGFARVTDRSLATAVLWPAGHVRGSGPLPVIVSPYGGPHHARVVHAAGAFASDQWLADQGFAVVVIDGIGTPGRGPAWEFGVHLDLATGVLADQVAGLQALGELHPDLDLGRVGITGWSFGGMLAGLAVLDRPDVFHSAVSGAPVAEQSLYDTAYTERYLGLPDEQPEAYRVSSLLWRAPQLERPLLIIHGLADDNVLAANTLQMSSALLAAGKPHSVLPLSGVTHMTPQEIVAENLLRLEVQFFQDHLGGA